MADPKLDSTVDREGMNLGIFSEISTEVDQVIQKFIHAYESQNRVTIIEYKLEQNKLSEAESSNYISTVIARLNFTFQKHEEDKLKKFSSSVVLKIPQLGEIYHFGTELLFYQKEKFMYEEVIPRMCALWPHREKPFINFYAATDSGILVLENLLESGFKMKQRESMIFNLAECKAVLKSLAQFHALSSKQMVGTIPAKLNSLTRVDWGNNVIAASFALIFPKFEKHVMPLVSENARSIILNLKDNYSAAIEFGYLPNENGFNVIVHGDSHGFNLLLRENREDKSIIDCKLIDLQASRCGSPVIDLLYFLVINVHPETFDNHRESFFSYYLQIFSETRNQIKDCTNNREYELNDLNADLNKYKFFFHYVLIIMVPLVWAGGIEIGSGEQENNFDELLKSEEYISHFKGWIKYFE